MRVSDGVKWARTLDSPMKTITSTYTFVLFALALAIPAAYAQLPTAMQAAIDQAAHKVLADTGSTSASIAAVKDGRVAYVQAYGDARLDPKVPATSAMRYKIGSNTKQFIRHGHPAARRGGQGLTRRPRVPLYPGLTRGNEIPIRQLLSHTSGYQDYYPLDYVAPFITRATTLQGILDVWAKKPLDFEPGTQW